MSGHLEEAAAVFNAAAEQVPIELAQRADQQLAAVVQYIQQAGPLGEDLTGLTVGIQKDLERVSWSPGRSLARSGPAATPAPSWHAVTAGDGSQYPSAASWCADVMPRRVRERQPGRRRLATWMASCML